MFCVGAKIAFSDGRAAVARNAEEMNKIFAMDVVIASIVCNADSVTLDILVMPNGTAVARFKNFDLKQVFVTEFASLDIAKKAALKFIDSGECDKSLPWSPVEWTDRG